MRVLLVCLAGLLVCLKTADSHSLPQKDYDTDSSKPDITNPLNDTSGNNSSSVPDNSSGIFDSNTTIFIVRYVTRGDKKEYKGIYAHKNGKVKKILVGGRAFSDWFSKSRAYLGHKDGIYVYDTETEKLEKYGNLSDSIIGILKENRTDDLYILTEDHVVYKVIEEGTKKIKINEAEHAEQIALDWDDNLYYIGANNQPYVVTSDGAKKIEGLPANPTSASFSRAPITTEHRSWFMSGKQPYIIYPNATSEPYVFNDQEKLEYEKRIRALQLIFLQLRNQAEE
ncbi:uncharacterized protein LOC119628723 [Bombyx mori]|uniref:Uncharacterized protein n=1 Tax=Bombyx mori TaxID=7091 RepID=A0A8R2QYI5_BOMMO|nr:uncharacterized protein LOC119628723 [Bombyx mori]XP_037867976.1 uncharacterized protein LOC119628723 [Bombyx mori]